MEAIHFIQSFSNPLLDIFFIAVTMLGEESIYIFLLAFVFWCIDKKFGYKLAFAFLFSSIANNTAKEIFKAVRPLNIDNLRHLRVETATGYSFPSGHTQNVTAFSVSIMKKFKKRTYYILGCFPIFLVAVSRLYLGVHWPRDVIGGIIFGVLSVLLAEYLFDFAERTKKPYILLLLVLPVLLSLLLFRNSHDLYKASGVFLSFLVGYFIENKYIHFNTKAAPMKQLIKFVLGITVFLIIKSVLKVLFPQTLLSDLTRYFVLGIWVTVAAPYTFKLFHLTDGSCLSDTTGNTTL